MAKVVLWIDEFYPSTGGLQRRTKMMADRLSPVVEVDVLTHFSQMPDDLPYRVLQVSPPDSVLNAESQIRRLLASDTCLYICRLLPGQEVEHARAISRLAASVRTLVRAQSTRGAEILASPTIRNLLDGRLHEIHALNEESCTILKNNYHQTIVSLEPNTVQHFPISSPTKDGPIVVAGRIVPEKMPLEVIRGWITARATHSVPSLHIYGRVIDADYFSLCLDAIAGTDARYKGEYKFDDWGPLRGASGIVIASQREGHSNVATEAMMHGAVVVARAVPGLAEHLRDGRGIEFPPQATADEIARALCTFHEMTLDEYESMRYSAYDYAQSLARHDGQLDSIIRATGGAYEI